MADIIALTASDCNQLYDVNSEVLMFKVKYQENSKPFIKLYSEPIIDGELFKIYLGNTITIVCRNQDSHICDGIRSAESEYKAYWLTWHDGRLNLGIEEDPKAVLSINIEFNNIIQFAQFGELNENTSFVKWVIYKSPVNLKPIRQLKDFEGSGGQLRWIRMTVNDNLPHDALIGGFEGEPLYIIRAEHNRSLCPGKFLRHKKKAYVSWGHREHPKEMFEVLCGLDVHWESTTGSKIPKDALVAGYSEVRQEPLYVGRARHNNFLLVGKVHTLYSTCYLPYHDEEIEKGSYEILVKGNTSDPRVILNA